MDTHANVDANTAVAAAATTTTTTADSSASMSDVNASSAASSSSSSNAVEKKKMFEGQFMILYERAHTSNIFDCICIRILSHGLYRAMY